MIDFVKFDCIEELTDKIIDAAQEDTYVSVIAKYEQAKDIIKELMFYDDTTIDNIELLNPDADGYEDEYIIDTCYIDGDILIGCEPLKKNGEYLNCEGDILYILEDCREKIIDHCSYNRSYIAVIGEDECDCCECCDCDNNKPYILNLKLNLDTDEAEKKIRKYRNDFYKEIAIFKEFLDF